MTIPKQDTYSGIEDGHDMEDDIRLSTFKSYIIFGSVCTFRSLSGKCIRSFFLVPSFCAHLTYSSQEQVLFREQSLRQDDPVRRNRLITYLGPF